MIKMPHRTFTVVNRATSEPVDVVDGLDDDWALLSSLLLGFTTSYSTNSSASPESEASVVGPPLLFCNKAGAGATLMPLATRLLMGPVTALGSANTA